MIIVVHTKTNAQCPERTKIKNKSRYITQLRFLRSVINNFSVNKRTFFIKKKSWIVDGKRESWWKT